MRVHVILWLGDFLRWDFVIFEVLKHLNFRVVNLYSIILSSKLRGTNPIN